MGKELETLVVQLKSSVAEVVARSYTKAEVDEQMKKITDDFTEVQAAMKEQRLRMTALPGADVGGGGGAYLAQNGFGTVKAASNLHVYDTHARTGQTIDRLLVPDEVVQCLTTMDEVYLIDAVMMLHSKLRSDWVQEKASLGEREAFLKRFPEVGGRHDATVKAMAAAQGKTIEEFTSKTMTTGGVGTGAEWIPTQFSSMLLDVIRLETPEVNLIPHMTQPRNNWTFPILNTIGKAYRKIENVDSILSDIGTANRPWVAHVHAVYHAFTDEIDQDSIVAIAPQLRFSLVRSMSEGMAMAIVNGDNDAASHIDDDYATATAPYFTHQGGINGLRQFALDADGTGTAATIGGGGDALSFADVGSALAIMGKFAARRVGDTALLVSTEGWLRLVTEADSPLMTIDKYGPQATILSGEVARVFGVPVLISHAVEQRKNMVATTGVNTGGSGDSLSTALVFNRHNFRIGDLRDFRIETDRNIIAMRDDMVASTRISMNTVEGDVGDANWDPLNDAPAVVAIINIT